VGPKAAAFDISCVCRRIGKWLRASVLDTPPQAAMRGIGIQPRVPEQGHRELRRGDRQGKTVHAGSQFSGVSFGNASDQVGGPMIFPLLSE